MENLSQFFAAHWKEILSVLVYSVLEFWLGRTTKTKAGSVLELALNLVTRKGATMEKYGVKETIEMVDLGLSLANVGLAVGEDKKVDASDLPKVFAAVPGLVVAVPAAIQGADQIDEEMSDLSVEEAAEVVAHVVGKLAVSDEHAKAIVVDALDLAASVGVKTLKLVKSIQAAKAAKA